MRISTNQFLLGSLNDLLTQQSNVNRLNREIATGQTMLDATTDPAGASQALIVADTIGRLTYDTANAQAASQTLQSGVAVLQQVSTLISQLRQTAIQAANGTNTATDQLSLVEVAQNALAQLTQLANTQAPNGSYLFAGSRAGTAPFASLASGQVVFNGDGNVNTVEIAPSLSVASTVSPTGVFTGLSAGNGGVAVSVAGSNTGSAVATPAGVTSLSQLAAERVAGTQFAIAFAAGPSGLTYSVASGTGIPGSAGFAASSGIVASGAFTTGADLVFGGVDIRFSGTPAAGDGFTVATGASTSVFQTVQNLIAALHAGTPGHAGDTLAQQQLENVISDLGGAETGLLSAQASLGASLAQIQAVQGQNSALGANAQVALSNLQSANLPQVLANYSESVTALQAAQLAFARIQNLTLFSVIRA